MTDYDLLELQLRSLLDGEADFLANAGNTASFVYHELPQLNWAGWYFASAGDELVLGPFQGRPACTRLPAGRGVCGAAFSTRATVVVDDVTAFADHIVCDTASASEVVVPLCDERGPYGVFDIDSPRRARFTPEDQNGIERLVGVFMARYPRRAEFLARRAQ